jgi:hypothetical protein
MQGHDKDSVLGSIFEKKVQGQEQHRRQDANPNANRQLNILGSCSKPCISQEHQGLLQLKLMLSHLSGRKFKEQEGTQRAGHGAGEIKVRKVNSTLYNYSCRENSILGDGNKRL